MAEAYEGGRSGPPAPRCTGHVLESPERAGDLGPRPPLRGARVARRRPHGEPLGAGHTVVAERVLEQEQLARYADGIVKGSLAVTKGETLVVQAEPAHRELAIALVEA